MDFISWDLVERSCLTDAYEISALIVQRVGAARGALDVLRGTVSARGFFRFLEYRTFRLIRRVEEVLVGRMFPVAVSQRTKRVDAYDIPRLEVAPVLSGDGVVFQYSKEDLSAISELELDVVVKGGSGVLRGEILTIFEYGVLSCHHGDDRVNRGGPAGFWEACLGVETTGFTIRRLRDDLDGGDVLFKGKIATRALYLKNQSAILYKSAPFFDLLLKRIARCGSLPAEYPSLPYACPPYSIPHMGAQLRYMLRILVRLGRKACRRIFHRQQRWTIAYQRVPDWERAVLWRSRSIKNPPCRYLADPFVWTQDGREVIFAEDFDFRTGKGDIAAIDITGDDPKYLGVVLSEQFHLSFPYLFEADGSLYMVPESHQAGEIRLYKCEEFPGKWSLHKVLIKDISAVDTMIFPHAGRWWMLTNIDSAGMMDYESELHLYHADRFDSDTWVPHPGNPVVFDASRARNGGMLYGRDGAIYRVFQRQGIGVYGAGMGIARITLLDRNVYAEEVIMTIGPDFARGAQFAHSLSHRDGILVLDYGKYERISS